MPDAADLPDFIIGGAPRSGTTFLCHALARHPDIFLAKPYIPEPKVFMGNRRLPEEYLAHYRALFADRGRATHLGEKTSYYLESEFACNLIRDIVPAARMIFIVREPVARAYSNYLWSTKNGLETLSFEQAIALEGTRASPLPPEKAYARPYDYLVRGDYATHARRYFDALGRDRVAFYLYEDIEQRPVELLTEIQSFIGVEPIQYDFGHVGLVNSARNVGPPINPETEQRLRALMAPLVKEFGALTGLDLESWGYPT